MKTYDIRLNGSMYDYIISKCELAMGRFAVRRDAEDIIDRITERLIDAAPDYWWPEIDYDAPGAPGVAMHPLCRQVEDACVGMVLATLEPNRARRLIMEFEVAALELLEVIDKHDRMVATRPVYCVIT